MSQNKVTEESTRIILQTLIEEKPSTVEELTRLVSRKLRLSQEEVMSAISILSDEGKVSLSTDRVTTFSDYLRSGRSAWYWSAWILAGSTVLSVLLISGNAYPWQYLRAGLGLIFALWLPGYAIVRALLPLNRFGKTAERDIELIERIGLSIGLSIALIVLCGIVLHYVSLGVGSLSMTLTLLFTIGAFATAAIRREYREFERRQKRIPT